MLCWPRMAYREDADLDAALLAAHAGVNDLLLPISIVLVSPGERDGEHRVSLPAQVIQGLLSSWNNSAASCWAKYYGMGTGSPHAKFAYWWYSMRIGLASRPNRSDGASLQAGPAAEGGSWRKQYRQGTHWWLWLAIGGAAESAHRE